MTDEVTKPDWTSAYIIGRTVPAMGKPRVDLEAASLAVSTDATKAWRKFVEHRASGPVSDGIFNAMVTLARDAGWEAIYISVDRNLYKDGVVP
jgi:hypothetical protein